MRDDFCLEKIAFCGQCFRAKKLLDGSFLFIHGAHAINIKQRDAHTYEISATEEEWKNIWRPYFDLSRSYRAVRRGAKGKNDFLDQALKAGRGIRVLRQDPWEMLITFIISQRKSIPAIRSAAESLAEAYGESIALQTLAGETLHLHTFPTAEKLAHVTEEEFRARALGYRAPYVRAAVLAVLSGSLKLEEYHNFDDETLLKQLQNVHGVGIKVANCVALFAYARMACVPVDVWIARAMEEAGADFLSSFSESAGILQQYVFYYQIMRKK